MTENIKSVSINIFELACYLIGSLVVAYAFGRWFSAVLGDAGWFLGAFLGVLAAVVALIAVTHAIELWYSVSPLQPVCSAGKCTSEDYRFQQSSDDGLLFECKCGERYLKAHRRFIKLTGTERQAYMRKAFAGRWAVDRN